MSDVPAPPSQRRPGYLLLLVGALSTFGPLALDLFLAGLPTLASDLRADPATAQLSISLCLVGLALGQVIAGPLSDRIGRRWPLLAGVAVFTVSAFGCALAPDIVSFLALRLLTGLGGGAGVVIARAMVRDLYAGPAALRAFSLVAVVAGVAPVVAPLLGSGLLLFTTWRGVFVALGLIGAVLVVAAFLVGETHPPERRSATPAPVLSTMAGLLADRSFVLPALALGLASSSMFTYISMGSFVLQSPPYGLSEQAYGGVFAANAVGITAAARLNAQLAPRWGASRMLLVGILLGLAAALMLLVLTLTGGPLWSVLTVLFVSIGSVGFTFANATYLAMDGHASAGGSASALLGLGQFLLGAIIPPVASTFGVNGPLMAGTMLACVATGLLAALLIPRPAHPHGP